MTGYQEILTDPSYCRQIVTLTYPHIGNTGTNPEDLEAGAVYAAGLIIRDLPALYSNWRASESLESFLQRGKVVAIADIDTRKLTRILREKGALAGCIMTGEKADADGCRARGAQVPRPQGHGPREGRLDQARLSVERRHELGARARGRRRAPASACTSSRTTSASSATSCAARRSRLPHHRRAGADAGGAGARDESRRHLPVERPRRSGAVHLRDRRDPRSSWRPTSRSSASASATSCSDSRAMRRR